MKDDSTLIKFPCDFTIKVVGRAGKEFEEAVIIIVRRHFPEFSNDDYKKRLSRDANFLALSITIHAKNKAALDALYQELSNSPFVIMAL